MSIRTSIAVLLVSASVTACISTEKHQAVIDNSKRLELLLEKERQDNDQLNAQRSIYESQILALQNNNNKLLAENTAATEALKQQIVKLNAEITKRDERNKALELSLQQEKDKYASTVKALDDKIDDLAEDKQELQQQKYELRKQVAKKSVKKRRRRRR
jgi:hypothetical protein